MAQWLRQGTAYTFQLGPFVDETTGKDAESSLTIAYTDCYLSKAGATRAAKSDTTNLTGTGDSAGYYDCVLNTTDTGTRGTLQVSVHVAGALPVWQEFMVVSQTIWDSFFSTTAGAIPNVVAGVANGLTIAGSNAATTFATLTSTGAFTAGSNAIPWNSAWDTEVQSECQDALEANNLDHLVKSAVETNFATTVHNDSVIGQLAEADGGSFDRSTDSLEKVVENGATAIEVADAVLARDLGSGTGEGTLNERTVRSALRLLRNKRSVAGGVLTVCKENDTDTAWTAAVTGTSGADPITAIDPT